RSSGREHVLGRACGAVTSGGYCRHRAGDGELALDVFQTRPTAIGTPQRMPEMPISGREHVLGLACGAVASGGYYRHWAGDGELALNVSQTLPTAIGTPQRMPGVPIIGCYFFFVRDCCARAIYRYFHLCDGCGEGRMRVL